MALVDLQFTIGLLQLRPAERVAPPGGIARRGRCVLHIDLLKRCLQGKHTVIGFAERKMV